MKNKYFLSGGLGLAQQDDLDKLRKLSIKGYQLESNKIGLYKLTYQEEKEYLYTIDYATFKKNQTEEFKDYLDFYKDSGWIYVCSCANTYHYFKSADLNVVPIITDEETQRERDTYLSKLSIKTSLICLLLSFLIFFSITLFNIDIKLIKVLLAMLGGGLMGIGLVMFVIFIVNYKKSFC